MKSLFCATFATAAMSTAVAQHVPEYRLPSLRGGAPASAAESVPADTLDPGNYFLAAPRGTLKLIGNLSTTSYQHSITNYDIDSKFTTSGSTTTKARNGELQFISFDGHGRIRIDRGNVNGDGPSGLMETLFVFNDVNKDELRLVRTKKWNAQHWQGPPIAPASEMCSFAEKTFHNRSAPEAAQFPTTTFDIIAWNMGFDESQNVASSWTGENVWSTTSAPEHKPDIKLGPKLGYPFPAPIVSWSGRDDCTARGKDTQESDGTRVGHWTLDDENIGYDWVGKWSVRLDGKWKGFPVAFEHHVTQRIQLNDMQREYLSIKAEMEPHVLKTKTGKVIGLRELFPEDGLNFAKC